MLKCKALSLTIILCAITAVAPAQKKPATRPNQESRQNNSAEANKAAVQRMFEAYSQGRFDEARQLYAPNCKVQFGGRGSNVQESLSEAKGWKSAAPDLVMSGEQISANGDTVTVNWVATGTHTGRGNGLKPTGKRVNVRGKSEFRFANGKIVEAHNTEYRDQLYRQLGVPKNAAAMMIMTEDLWASVKRMLPDPLYASLQ